MAHYGWMINLTGAAIPVYSVDGGGPSTTKIGTITKNECFIDGTYSANPWEGEGTPVFFFNKDHVATFGLFDDYSGNLAEFADYASNGTSWIKVNTLERKVQYDTSAYNQRGDFLCKVPAGTPVELTRNCTAGDNCPNYIAVTSIAGKTYDGHVFIDLTPNNRWVNVGSILLRKA